MTMKLLSGTVFYLSRLTPHSMNGSFPGSLDSQSVKQVERAYSIIESVVHAVASSPRRANCTHYRRYRNTEDCSVAERFRAFFFL